MVRTGPLLKLGPVGRGAKGLKGAETVCYSLGRGRQGVASEGLGIVQNFAMALEAPEGGRGQSHSKT